ncbi:MAG: hypothetical protein HN842_01445 [Gammaproteobacteria bacterium]|nr:hypothetical protein [Gammaproteobacteria bacterium]
MKNKFLPKKDHRYKSIDYPLIHWGAMGAGLVTASLLYPEFRPLLIALGSSSLMIHWFEKIYPIRQAEQSHTPKN